ncbi:MAG TPA: shikimate dehydrogenase [Atribacteraceae bacterium]|nr:shikimate dehydrogenase [Atribacteraceae bacterium]
MISGQTRLLALIGHPIVHSLSPAFQNAALEEMALPFVYMAFDVPSEHLAASVAGLRALGAAGFNVTVPHKEKVIPYLDHLDITTTVLQAVNTVVIREGKLVGYNTDVEGLKVTLQKTNYTPGEPVCLLGAGGAARAVLYALIHLSGGPVTVFNRNRDRAESLRDWVRASLNREITIESWESFVEGKSAFLDKTRVLINATSLGLADELPPIPWDALSQCHSIIDTVYRRDDTPLVREARKRGFLACDGKTMLIGQGAASFTLFTGWRAPVELMERALL